MVGPLVAVALAGGAVAVAAHQDDPAFLYEQQSPARVEALAVQQLVLKAPEPVPQQNRPAATRASCRPGSKSPFGNPWQCRVTYASHDRLTYRVTVDATGAIHGIDRTGTGLLSGCCVQVPKKQ